MSICGNIDGDWSWNEPGYRLNDAYSAAVLCSNCSYGFPITAHLYVRKGKEVSFVLKSIPCPECGCSTLMKASW